MERLNERAGCWHNDYISDERGCTFKMVWFKNRVHRRLARSIKNQTRGLSMLFLSGFDEKQLFAYNRRLNLRIIL